MLSVLKRKPLFLNEIFLPYIVQKRQLLNSPLDWNGYVYLDLESCVPMDPFTSLPACPPIRHTNAPGSARISTAIV